MFFRFGRVTLYFCTTFPSRYICYIFPSLLCTLVPCPAPFCSATECVILEIFSGFPRAHSVTWQAGLAYEQRHARRSALSRAKFAPQSIFFRFGRVTLHCCALSVYFGPASRSIFLRHDLIIKRAHLGLIHYTGPICYGNEVRKCNDAQFQNLRECILQNSDSSSCSFQNNIIWSDLPVSWFGTTSLYLKN